MSKVKRIFAGIRRLYIKIRYRKTIKAASILAGKTIKPADLTAPLMAAVIIDKRAQQMTDNYRMLVAHTSGLTRESMVTAYGRALRDVVQALVKAGV